MIKSLINELVYDKISLNQALTRSKIIAYEIDNKTFQDWLKKELEGYSEEDINLPQYRIIKCKVKIELVDPFGMYPEIIPLFFGVEKFDEMIGRLDATQSISKLENNVNTLTGDVGKIDLTPSQINVLRQYVEANMKSYKTIRSGWKEIGKLQLKEIIDLTKQKLIDILLELDKEFLNLSDNYKMTENNSDKVQNIITNNIFGNNNPVNQATGYNVEQKDFSFNSLPDFSKLEELGVQNNDIEDLKNILVESKNDPENYKSKIFKWLGSVSSSVAARGLYDHIPAITDFIHKLI